MLDSDKCTCAAEGEQLVHFELNTERLKERLHAAQPPDVSLLLHCTPWTGGEHVQVRRPRA